MKSETKLIVKQYFTINGIEFFKNDIVNFLKYASTDKKLIDITFKGASFTLFTDRFKTINATNEKENISYEFKTSCTEYIDILEISNNITERNPVILVQTGTHEEKYIIIYHRKLYRKNSLLGLKDPIYNKSTKLPNEHFYIEVPNAKSITDYTAQLKYTNDADWKGKQEHKTIKVSFLDI